MVHFSGFQAYCDLPGGENYTGDNPYCDYYTTIEQPVIMWWTNKGTSSPSEANWVSEYLEDWTYSAQRLAYETCVDWATRPFDRRDDPTNNRVAWSDTWGICVYFSNAGVNRNVVVDDNHPDPITSYADLEKWHNSTVAGVDVNIWRVVAIDNFTDELVGTNGITGDIYKMSWVKKNQADKIWLHEYGHTDDSRTSGTGQYQWPDFNDGEYGIPDNHERNYNMNYMNFDNACGLDGDENYKINQNPWTGSYPGTKRECENWD
jgi:hypothetical protein